MIHGMVGLDSGLAQSLPGAVLLANRNVAEIKLKRETQPKGQRYVEIQTSFAEIPETDYPKHEWCFRVESLKTKWFAFFLDCPILVPPLYNPFLSGGEVSRPPNPSD